MRSEILEIRLKAFQLPSFLSSYEATATKAAQAAATAGQDLRGKGVRFMPKKNAGRPARMNRMPAFAKYPCPYCLDTFASFESIRPHILADHAAETLSDPEGTIRVTVNGYKYKFQVEPDWTLHCLLHDKMGLTGTKLMCDRGACGPCTVIMNRRPILSCMTLPIECNGKEIETVEGIAATDHPLIGAYIKHHCMQCGYCTPSFVVTAKALLDRNNNPTEQEIREALGGNLCRCGTYPQHPKAILEAAQLLREARKP